MTFDRSSTLRLLRRDAGDDAGDDAGNDGMIAVVGMACRYPGGCDDPESLWRLVEEGGCAISPVPEGRWPGGEALSRYGTHRVAGFLDPSFPRCFDADFFGISAAEAAALDPQQRLLLETGWRAIEDAALAVDIEHGREIGVFVAISTGDHQRSTLWQSDIDGVDAFTATGASFAAAAGRLSYSFGFTGPSMAVDTACSSSLMALHLARQAIRNGECEQALVLGVNALLRPNLFRCLETMGLLSPDGICRPFDAGANGYVRAEGCGALILKPLSEARRDGNRIRAIIRGSAVNQDGRTAGLTAPSGKAQERVIGRALADAKLSPGEIDYVEAHGTGTPLGDAIELNALARHYAADRDPAGPLLVGSVKANIGHLEAGAGLAGVIKTMLALEHATVPGHPRLDRPTPELDWSDVPMLAPTVATPWPERARPRRAAVSSFGFSGTNAHVVLEQAPPNTPREPAGTRITALLLSARTPAALDEFAATLADWLEAAPRDLRDAAYTLSVGRAAFPHRRVVLGESQAGLVAALRGASATPPGKDGDQALLAGLAELWLAGEAVDWGRLYRVPGARHVALPGHPLRPRYFWRDESVPGDPAERVPASPGRLPRGAAAWRDMLHSQASAVLGSDAPLDGDVPLIDQGFTSLLGQELRRALEVALDRPLPVGLLYDYPTLGKIARLLSGEEPARQRRREPPLPAAGEATNADLAFLDALSAADLAVLIDREVDRL